MQYQKSVGAIVFYIFIIIFIVLAYLNNNGTIATLFQKKSITTKKNIIQIKFNDKEYRADYTKKFGNSAIEISGFEEGEKWKGDYIVDDVNPWEGKTSYVVIAKGLQSNILTLHKSINLSDTMNVKMLVYSSSQQNIDDIKRATLRLGNLTDTAYFEYDIRNIGLGWNIIEMSKNNFSYVGKSASANEEDSTDTTNEKTKIEDNRLWGSIEKVTLELSPRPNTQVELSYDRLWAEKNADYKKEFLTKSFDMLSTKSWGRKSYINCWSLGGTLSLINKVIGVRNFTYTAKVVPQKIGSFGINARTDLDSTYGYYLDFGGIGSGTWRLYKYGKVVNDSPITELDSGGIANFQIEANQPLWLRLVASNNVIAGYLSMDGKNFTKLTEKDDGELASGGIGIHMSGASLLLESVEFKQ